MANVMTWQSPIRQAGIRDPPFPQARAARPAIRIPSETSPFSELQSLFAERSQELVPLRKIGLHLQLWRRASPISFCARLPSRLRLNPLYLPPEPPIHIPCAELAAKIGSEVRRLLRRRFSTMAMARGWG